MVSLERPEYFVMEPDPQDVEKRQKKEAFWLLKEAKKQKKEEEKKARYYKKMSFLPEVPLEDAPLSEDEQAEENEEHVPNAKDSFLAMKQEVKEQKKIEKQEKQAIKLCWQFEKMESKERKRLEKEEDRIFNQLQKECNKTKGVLEGRKRKREAFEERREAKWKRKKELDEPEPL
eukprot:TRINITY_DN1492_c2_g1_i1.p1 TRINITY_DN1492_c2_g1~~TRINITY_DN1492_c2_g1_i1.p1  ORF type:complete len:175 (+),score=63.00 TRINITY_DN1492_c2_g1_i1:233-757(+)